MICNLCEHEQRFHLKGSDGSTICNTCFSCYFTEPDKYFGKLTAHHAFEDNLSFVERIAKQRNLI